MGKREKGLFVFAVLVVFMAWAVPAFAVTPPKPGELEGYQRDGTLGRRIKFARSLGCDRFHPALIQRKLLEKKFWENGGKITDLAEVEQLPYVTGFPAEGTPRMFGLLIDFPDYPHSQAQSLFADKLFGDGESNEFPYESLTQFYFRSSYGLLNIQGDAFNWYTAGHNRNYYGAEDNSGVVRLIKEALTAWDATIDFTQYDNNSDGEIDYFCVFWSGPDTGWGSVWWGWCDTDGSLFARDSFTVDGKTLGTFSWQWEKNVSEGEPVFSPLTAIHETGHAMGLPDYYDYNTSVGPDGGLGGMDMMDAAIGDHNCFSKWMLDWLTPTVIGNSGASQVVSLLPSNSAGECVLIMPGATVSNPFGEYFMAQTRFRAGNDLEIPTDGLIIWHVDATLNTAGSDFKYENSYAAHKLVRLMEADGLEEIEHGRLPIADAGDFYVTGSTFSPTSIPDSDNYAGNTTNVTVNSISVGACSVAATYSIPVVQEAGITVTSPNGGETWTKGTTVTISWSYTGDPGSNVSVELLKGSVVNTVISSGTPISSGSCTWTIPYSQRAGYTYRIRVKSTSSSATIKDTSDTFFTIRR